MQTRRCSPLPASGSPHGTRPGRVRGRAAVQTTVQGPDRDRAGTGQGPGRDRTGVRDRRQRSAPPPLTISVSVYPPAAGRVSEALFSLVYGIVLTPLSRLACRLFTGVVGQPGTRRAVSEGVRLVEGLNSPGWLDSLRHGERLVEGHQGETTLHEYEGGKRCLNTANKAGLVHHIFILNEVKILNANLIRNEALHPKFCASFY